MRRYFLTLWLLMLVALVAQAQTARVQVIHNSPALTVDVYVNGALLLNDFAFRTAQPYVDLPAGQPLSIAVAPGNSSSVADAIATFPLTFEEGKTYAVTASGVVGSTSTPFTLITDDKAQEVATVLTKVSLNMMHGAPDAPPVDVALRTGSKVVSNLAYGQHSPYLSVDPGVYYVDVKPAGSSTILGTYKADLSTFAGGAVRILASGYLNGSPGFGLYAVAADGAVFELPSTPVARVQVLHNSPDQAVDVWANDERLLDDFAFLSATPFMYLPAGVQINVGIADEFSEAAQDTFYNIPLTLTNGKTYLLTAVGLPGDPNTPFRLAVYDQAREISTDTNRVELAFQHSMLELATNALNFRENYLNTLNANDVNYAQTSAYSSFAPGVSDFGAYLQPSNILLREGRTPDLAKGTAGVVFATSVPNASPSHQLRLLRPDGSVTLLSQPRRTNLQVVHNSPSARMDVYYGGHLVANNFDFRYFSNIEVYSDRPATLSIAPDTSTSVKSAVVAFPIALEQGKNTAAYIDGVLGDTATPLALYTREIGFGPLTNDIELTLHHGAPGAPAIDVAVEGMGNVYTDLAYGENSGSIYLPPGVYQIKVKKAGTEQVVGEFEADLSQLAPIKAANVFASGFTDKNPVFGLWYTSLDYNTPPAGQLAFEFPRKVAFTKAQFIHNAASPTVDVYINGGQAFDNVAYRSASGFLDIPAGLPLSIAFAPENSVSAAEAFATFDVVLDQSKTYVITVSGIVGSTATPFTLLVHDAALLESPDPAQVAVAVLHGSTDAPAVDIDAVFVAHDVVSDLAYGAYTDYLTLPPDVYDLAIRASGSPDVLAMYRADLSGLAGVAATVFASGTLGGSPAFGLFAALADGTVTQLPLTPTARVQLIHNAPDPTVDVYAGNTRLLDDFAFRSATPFLSLPADRPIRLGMAPAGSASAADTLAGFGINLATDETYALFANGIVGNPSTPFTLLPDAAREAAADTSKVEVALLHGAPGAPAVDIDLLSGNMLLGTVPDLAYGEFISYLALDPADYRIRIRPNGSPLAVATYIADLSTWKGRAARIFASGILGGMPAFGLFAALPDGTVIEFPVLPPPPSARVQIIHNAADPTVDIYADGLLLLDDFPYRTATSFISLPAELPLSIALAPANSSSVADAIAVFPLNLEKDKRYVVVASGTVGSTATPFTLLVNDQALESAQTAGEVAVSVLHGSTDAPAVDVDALFDTDNLVQNLAYGQFSVDYLSLLPQVYDLALRATGSPDVLASYRADLSALAGQALTVFASGALGGTPGFGLFAALSNGAVVELPLTPTARVQLIHNSPDPTVDVYAGNTRLLDDFAFRKATPFVTLPADRPIAFAVAGENSTSPADALATFPLTFAPGLTYAVFAQGIVGDVNYPLTLLADGAREAASDPAKVELATLHGSPGAAAVDVNVFAGPVLMTDLAYGAFSPYLGVQPGNYVLQVKVAGTQTVIGNFQANLSALAGRAARVFASGLVGGTPGFGLFAALPDGTVVEFPQIAAPPTARVQIIHNSPSPTVDLYVNGNKFLDDFAFRTATPFVDMPAGALLSLAVAPASSQSVNDAIATFPLTLTEGRTYVVAANGIVGNPATPFTLTVNDAGLEAASLPGTVGVSVLHGAPDAPTVDVDEVLTGNLLSDLAYGEFTPYLALPPALYDVAVRATAATTPVGIYRADLSGLAGRALTVFASGLLGGSPGFGLFAALADGTVIELPTTPLARVQIIHNSPSPTVDVYAGALRLVDDFAFRTATPFVALPAARGFRVGVAPGTSSSVADTLLDFAVNFEAGKRYTVIANGVVGNPATPFTLAVDADAQEAAAAGFVAVSAFHGSPGAPAVDISERLAGPLVQGLAYGEFAPYLNLPPDAYYLDIRATGSPDIVDTYFADFSGLNGQALRVFASGMLGGAPAFGLFAALADGTVIELPSSPVARLQLLHNAPSASVDVYVSGQKMLDDFDFRTGTPFLFVPAGVALPLGIAPANSQSANDVIATFAPTLTNGGTYVAAVQGVAGGSPALSLVVNSAARERALDQDRVEVAVLHGIVDAPAVDVSNWFTDGLFVSDLAYGEFTDYLSLPPAFWALRASESGNLAKTAGIWAGDFSAGAGLAAVLFATGRIGDDTHDLWVLLPDGSTLPMLAAAEAQMIHDAIGTDVVDVYYDQDVAIQDFEFRTATNYGLFPARSAFALGIAPGNSQSAADITFSKALNLRLGKTYTFIPAGEAGTPQFDVFVNENARFAAFNPANAEFNLFHGSPNAPEVDVARLGGSPVLFDNVQFGEYTDYMSVPPADYPISVTPADNNSLVVQSYRADVSGLAGQAFTVFASGLLGGTPAFELWAALADGLTFALPVLVNTDELDQRLSDLSISPNPAVYEVMLRFSLTEPEALRYALRDLTGRLVMEGDLGLVPAGDFAQRLDVSQLVAGMYTLELRSDTGLRSLKVVVAD